MQHFRVRKPRIQLHSLEKLLLVIVAAQLILLPWMLGGMRVMGQFGSLGLAVAGFIVSLIPRDYDRFTSGEDAFRLYPARRLVRFPVFWLGLAFLGYVLIQAVNPAWTYMADGKVWWLHRLDNITWLPAGMVTPFDKANPWRSLMIYTSAFLPACAVWIGFTRRSTLRYLFTALATNGFLLACVGIAQRLEGNGKILWFIDAPNSYFVSSFIYKNHAAAYFNLILALTSGLALWHLARAMIRMEKSSPVGLYAFFATTIAVIVLFSFSRTGAILMVAFLLFALGMLFMHQRRSSSKGRHPVIPFLIVSMLIGFAVYGSSSLEIDVLSERFNALETQLTTDAPDMRKLVREATWTMANDKLVTGLGAGAFRFYFPQYQDAYPALVKADNNRRPLWEHAHNDYLETVAEVGIAGSALLTAMFGYTLWTFARLRCWRNPLALLGTAGLFLTLAHAWIDFQFQNPAILCTWCVLFLAYLRWSELDSGA